MTAVVDLKKLTKLRTIQSIFIRFKAPESKRLYPKRLEVFLNFINIDGSNLEERLYNLHSKSKADIEWLQD